MRSQTTLSPTPRPISVYEAELFARQERARLVGELVAEGILRAWRLIQRIAGAAKRQPARVAAS
jgi:hypothetical protein